MFPSHPEVIGRSSVETFGRSDAGSLILAVTKPRSKDTMAMVNQWLDSQSASSQTEGSAYSSQSRKSRDFGSSLSSSLSKKKVHWAANLEDFELYSNKNDAKSTKTKNLKPKYSKSKRREKYPPVPEPPKSREPPSTPRPRRLPTPELPELDHDEFCNCCRESATKMNTQLFAARQYMAGAQFSV